MLGWLRHKSALLLFIFGVTYFALFMYFSRPEGPTNFYLFISVLFLYHAFLRGNLIGIDRGAAWLNYMSTIPIEKTISAKSLSLTFLQGCMITPSLVTGFLRAQPGIAFPDGICIIAWIISTMSLGEILGIFFSIRHPEPIDRNDRFSGGMTAGGLLIPLLQILFLLVFVAAAFFAQKFFWPPAYWALLLFVPALLATFRFVLLPAWIRNAIQESGESILKNLRAFPT
jgi:hypothetical protein